MGIYQILSDKEYIRLQINLNYNLFYLLRKHLAFMEANTPNLSIPCPI